MTTNVVYLIGELDSGKIMDLQQEYFQSEIGFNSFIPSKRMAERYLERELGDPRQDDYCIVEAVVNRYADNVLEVQYEPFHFRY